MKDLGEAVSCADEKRTPRIFNTAVHNLAVGMTQSTISARDLSCVERSVTRASRTFSKKLLSAEKLKVCWLRGMIQIRFGSTRRGEATYRKVINGFLSLEEFVDVALVSVTLGKQLHCERRFDELHTLAIETNDVCERLDQQEPVKRAVLIWKETVVAGTVTADVFTTTWKVLEQASFERATGLNEGVSALPPRINVNVRATAERQIA